MRRFVLLLIASVLLSSCSQTPQDVKLHAADAVPQQLSAWQLLSVNNQRLSLNKHAVPYDLNSSLFTDYAHKLRTVWIPRDEEIGYSAEETFDFPVGTVISKTFFYPRAGGADAEFNLVLKQADQAQYFENGELDLSKVRLIETRLLVRQSDHWQALPYVWNDQQTDASLEITGDIKSLSLLESGSDVAQSFAYVVPDKNQCAGCHETNHGSKQLLPIGPKARHLHKASVYHAGTAQLTAWREKLSLTGMPETIVANADWQSSAEHSLDERARSYLDINCSHCHNPNGAADTSALLLNIQNENVLSMGVCKPPVAAGRGTGNRQYSIVPGNAEQSIMTFRMRSTKPGDMMPELGRSLAHTEGIALLSEWINALDGGC
ncbi:MAG: SO2930 family diheme c-type cytochrome [Pseudomonadota bacterium]